ncbi:MAG: TlpA family protein disulfide reductase [Candidatus Poseidoniales archaeon]
MRSILLSIALSLMLILPGCLGGEDGEDGEAFPDFSFTGDDGKEYSKDGLEGEKYIIQITASWCPRCFKTMHNISAALDGEIYLIASSDESDEDEIQSWHNKANKSNNSGDLEIPFTVLPDLATTLGINAMPTIYLISEKGNVIAKHEGDLTIHSEIIEFYGQEL